MVKALRRWWRYVGTLLGMRLDEAADPKVQLEQAIGEAREQHRLLTEQAANVIANQVQLQGRLDRSIEEYAQVTAAARQALLLADGARRDGDDARAATRAPARRLAPRSICWAPAWAAWNATAVAWERSCSERSTVRDSQMNACWP